MRLLKVSEKGDDTCCEGRSTGQKYAYRNGHKKRGKSRLKVQYGPLKGRKRTTVCRINQVASQPA